RWSAIVGLPTADTFRLDALILRDPHVFADLGGFFGCQDITDSVLGGLGPSFNDQLAAALDEDGDGDGLLDVSLVQRLQPLDPLAAMLPTESVRADCTAPVPSTLCMPLPGAISSVATYDGLDAGLCLEAIAGTTSGYAPAVPSIAGPCLVTAAQDSAIVLLDIALELLDVQLAGVAVGDPIDQLTPGLLIGFLPEATADAVVVPVDVPVLGGQPLSALLPGGTGNCATGDDRDMWRGQSGWWLYLESTARAVPFVVP
ncbi:MAG: hypothetical protein AAF772_04955, partial [Acidobacteriota bacterium]